MKNLFLEQNLCAATVFLNVFGLVLDVGELVEESSNVNILNSKDEVVGTLSFENGYVRINANIELGSLYANYKMANFFGFNDLECGGGFKQCRNEITFNVSGDFDFSGGMQIVANMDTDFGNTCRAHANISYRDLDGNNVVINFMNKGDPFSYRVLGEKFSEELWVNPWSKNSSYMYHSIFKGEYDSELLDFSNTVTKFVWNSGTDELRTFSHIIIDRETKEWDNQFYKKAGDESSEDLAIQKGLLMRKIDSVFSKKIIELRDLFMNGDVSVLSNLIEVTFFKTSGEVKEALFGINIGKIAYQNGADNLFDAYFDKKNHNCFLLEDAKKIVKD